MWVRLSVWISLLVLFSGGLYADESPPFLGHFAPRVVIDTFVETEDGMLVWVFTPARASRDETPVLVFLHGFYPTVGIRGYETLLRHVASRGINVIAPIYLADEPNAWIWDEVGDAMRIDDEGYDSREYAKQIRAALEDEEISPYLTSDAQVLYGHSMGALVAAALVEEEPTRFHGVLLDGIPDKEKIQDRSYLIIHGDEDGSRPQSFTVWPAIPTTILHYETDTVFQTSSQTAFESISPPKQRMVVRGTGEIQADHFSSFTNLKRGGWSPLTWVRGVVGLIVDAGAEEIHGYAPTFEVDAIDSVALYSLLPALAYAHTSARHPLSKLARDVLYGEGRWFLRGADTLRTVDQEKGIRAHSP